MNTRKSSSPRSPPRSNPNEMQICCIVLLSKSSRQTTVELQGLILLVWSGLVLVKGADDGSGDAGL